MEKIMLAVGHREMEEYLEKRLKNEFQFVGTSVYKDGVIRKIGQTNPDIVVIRETLEGKENILGIVYDIQVRFPHIRIVFIAGKRFTGDELLSILVSYGVYDILHGDKVLAVDIIRLIRQANQRKDVLYLQPKPLLDEQKNRIIFNAPDAKQQPKTVVKKVVEEIYVERKNDGAEVGQKHAVVETPPAEPAAVEDVQKPKKGISSFLKKNPLKSEEDSLLSAKEVPLTDVHEETDNKPLASDPVIEQADIETALTPLPAPEPEPAEVEGQNILAELFVKNRNAKAMGLNNQKILTFTSSKHGTGTTTMAFNTALQLAAKNRVLYVEMNEFSPAVPFWYELANLETGIETAIEAIRNNQLEKISKAIVSMKERKKEESDMAKMHKRFPDKLDLLTFSKKYSSRYQTEDGRAEFVFSRELYLYLLFQADYDYVILDVPANFQHPATQQAMLYSHHVFYVVTQDVAVVAQAEIAQHELKKQGIDLKKKITFILNRHEKAPLDVKAVCEWLEVPELIVAPSSNKEMIAANYEGIPFSLHDKRSVWKNVWKNILKRV